MFDRKDQFSTMCNHPSDSSVVSMYGLTKQSLNTVCLVIRSQVWSSHTMPPAVLIGCGLMVRTFSIRCSAFVPTMWRNVPLSKSMCTGGSSPDSSSIMLTIPSAHCTVLARFIAAYTCASCAVHSAASSADHPWEARSSDHSRSPSPSAASASEWISSVVASVSVLYVSSGPLELSSVMSALVSSPSCLAPLRVSSVDVTEAPDRSES